jgi:hypothetical protein
MAKDQSDGTQGNPSCTHTYKSGSAGHFWKLQRTFVNEATRHLCCGVNNLRNDGVAATARNSSFSAIGMKNIKEA